MMDRESVRAQYRPQRIETLFVGESPPASGKFFYYGNTALARAMNAAMTAAGLCDEANFLERFRALGECTSLVSDVMDELGVPEGVIGATVLKPTLPGKLIVGPALTVRNIRQRSDPLAAGTHVNRMAEFEAHNLASPGDVLVIQGVARMSNMGGI